MDLLINNQYIWTKMRDLVEIRKFLKTHWFSDKIELRKAREMLMRRFPDTREFNLRFYSVDGVMISDIITADDLREFIKSDEEKI